MRPANLVDLQDKIIRPDMDRHLVPLLLYKGAVSLGRMHRGWNFALTMMESECESFSDGVKLSLNPDYAHLIGPHAGIQMSGVRSLFGRLRDNPGVTDNVPGFTQYCRDVAGYSFSLQRISLNTNDPRCRSPWRVYEKLPRKPRARTSLDRAGTLFYPYLVHVPEGGNSERELLLTVNNAVPRGLPDHLRADICQDLLVAILAGEMQLSELQGSVKEYTRKVMRMHPMKYGDIGFDAPVSADDDTPFLDRYAPGVGVLEW